MEEGDDGGWENMISLVVDVVHAVVVWRVCVFGGQGGSLRSRFLAFQCLFLFACNAMHSDGCEGEGREEEEAGGRDEKYHLIVQYTSLAELNVAVNVVVVCLLIMIPHRRATSRAVFVFF